MNEDRFKWVIRGNLFRFRDLWLDFNWKLLEAFCIWGFWRAGYEGVVLGYWAKSEGFMLGFEGFVEVWVEDRGWVRLGFDYGRDGN